MKCKAYACKGTLHKEGRNSKCDTCKRIYGPPPDLKDYDEYENLFKDDLLHPGTTQTA